MNRLLVGIYIFVLMLIILSSKLLSSSFGSMSCNRLIIRVLQYLSTKVTAVASHNTSENLLATRHFAH